MLCLCASAERLRLMSASFRRSAAAALNPRAHSAGRPRSRTEVGAPASGTGGSTRGVFQTPADECLPCARDSVVLQALVCAARHARGELRPTRAAEAHSEQGTRTSPARARIQCQKAKRSRNGRENTKKPCSARASRDAAAAQRALHAPAQDTSGHDVPRRQLFILVQQHQLDVLRCCSALLVRSAAMAVVAPGGRAARRRRAR